ncbi:hypothetical protein C1X65_20390 [Pseudomonas sp. FW305-70]|nr:hypothetical protein C1X65_20390 [Pseudomonas sp. FW305-70]
MGSCIAPPLVSALTDCCWPIVLKKSAMVSTAEKYALEIEIFTLSRGFRAQISRSYAQKRHFQQSVRGQSGRTDFFNTIGRFLLVARGCSTVKSRHWDAPGKRVDSTGMCVCRHDG